MLNLRPFTPSVTESWMIIQALHYQAMHDSFLNKLEAIKFIQKTERLLRLDHANESRRILGENWTFSGMVSEIEKAHEQELRDYGEIA